MKEYQRLIVKPSGSFFLFGPRGSGKSTWLRQEFPAALYLDLLNEQVYQDCLRDPSYFSNKVNLVRPGQWVVVDEIQRIPSLLNEVHRFIEGKKIKFALSGSSARKLKKAGTNLLAGRAIRRELFPLTPEELGHDFKLEEILRLGSLPLVWSNRDKPELLETYVQTYLKEEVQAEALVRNLQGFARFLPIAALFHGQVLNSSTLARDAGVSRTSIIGYLDILEDTLLSFRLRPFEGKLRVKEKKHPKLYWLDPGIVRAAKRQMGPVAEEERGSLLEGWIASLLKAYQSYRKLFEEWNYWAPTETDSREVDFILWRARECIAIEVKSSRRFRSEFTKGLDAFYDGMPKKTVRRRMIVYLGSETLKTDSGIEVLPLETFLAQLQNDQLFPT